MPTFSTEIRDGDTYVFMVNGELDISNREELHEALQSVDGAAPRVLIDLCQCRYFDTTLLSELVRFYKARHQTQKLTLAASHGAGRWILSFTAIDKLLPVVECTHGRQAVSA